MKRTLNDSNKRKVLGVIMIGVGLGIVTGIAIGLLVSVYVK